MLLSYTIVDLHLFYDGAVEIQILAPLTRSHCKVSDTQVTVKVCGPLVITLIKYQNRISTAEINPYQYLLYRVT